LEKARRDVAQASEGHDDRQITRELVQRERDVTAEMKQLAEAVSAYHRALFHQPEDLVERRRAARRYLRVLREVRLHEKDWLTDFVLELGDVLANWSTPPAGAEQQIDRFPGETADELAADSETNGRNRPCVGHLRRRAGSQWRLGAAVLPGNS
jgi:multidrug efflux pump subunit AcrA (membrane-fusion protein)